MKKRRFQRLGDREPPSPSKRERIELINRIAGEFKIRGKKPEQTGHYLVLIAKFLQESDSEDRLSNLIDDWMLAEPKYARSRPADKPKYFYYYIRDYQLSDLDMVLFHAYKEIAQNYIKDLPPSRDFRGLGDVIFKRLARWIGDGGNDLEVVLIDYLKAVCKDASRFNIQLIRRIPTVIGDYGWTAFLAWIGEKYGGRNGYIEPNAKERAESKTRRRLYDRWTEVCAHAIRAGNLKMYDTMQDRATDWGNDAIKRIIEEHDNGRIDYLCAEASDHLDRVLGGAFPVLRYDAGYLERYGWRKK